MEIFWQLNFPVTPKKYAVVFDSCWLGSCNFSRERLLILKFVICSTGRLVSKVDVTKKKWSRKLIRIFLQKAILPSGWFFWSSLFGDLNWNQIWLNGGKFCLSIFESIYFLWPTNRNNFSFVFSVRIYKNFLDRCTMLNEPEYWANN